jgi:hypothetical protein
MTQEDKDKIKQVIELTVLYHESCNRLTVVEVRDLVQALTTRVMYLLDNDKESS